MNMKDKQITGSMSTKDPRYPWPPEEKYSGYHFGGWMPCRYPNGTFAPELTRDFVADFADINRYFRASTEIEGWTRYELWDDGAPGFREEYGQPQPAIIYRGHEGSAKGTVLVCPGGAFLWKASYEGMPVAQHFYDQGYNAAVLDYRTAPYDLDLSFADGKRAIRYLRANAQKLGITNDRIAILGFSAGGIMSAMTGTGFTAGDPDALDPVERFSSRPDAVVPCYGAFSSVAFPSGGLSYNRENQRYNALRSPDTLVSIDTPPFFIWQNASMDDPRNALNLARQLTIYGVPFELHIFPHGVHGTALSDGGSPTINSGDPHPHHWVELCEEWLNELGF